MSRINAEDGFSLAELLVATALLLVVSSIVTNALQHMTNSQKTIWNRTEMHSGVRGATELLQQEVGQAGRVTLPAPVTLGAAVATGLQTVVVSSVAGMFVNEWLTVDPGDSQETVQLTAVTTGSNQITATFAKAHPAAATVMALGGFATGVVPPQPGFPNGSTGQALKLYGDINADGNMIYVEYTCDAAGTHRLYRNVVAWNAANKPAVTASQVLLGNVVPNPGNPAPPCFSYQTATAGADTYVTDVAITLTVQTEQQDPITRQYQTETKALLNVSPRNVFNTWQVASLLQTDHVQPMPDSISHLLP